MKHRLFKTMLAMLFMLPVSAFAQKWNFGIEAGYVNNTLAVEEYKSTARNGFKFGANAEFTLSNHISFESGLAYIRKGATTAGDKKPNMISGLQQPHITATASNAPYQYH